MAQIGSGRPEVDRRVVMKGLGLGALGLASAPLLAACSTGSTGGTSGGKGGSFTFGSNISDPGPKKAFTGLISTYEKKSGATVKVTVTDHTTFQNKISNYLQGSPDDAFTWFSGYRMRYYAGKDLVGDASDVWQKISSNYSSGLKQAATASDGKQYLVPTFNYPWGWFYRKSFWQSNGWEVPKTLDDLISLAKKMKAKGIIPIALADKEGWPADGTFDYLNMRINGYQFHVDLCAHKQGWDTPQVKEVFDTWKQLREYQDPAALGYIWQDAAKKLADKKAGMMLLGSFITSAYTDKAVIDDIGYFAFPSVKVEAQDAIEAPIDGYMLSKRGATNQAAKDFLAYMGTGAGQYAYWKGDPSNLMTANDAPTDKYSAFSKLLSDQIKNAKFVSQFFDRDALPAMASNVLNPALQGFIKSGTIDLANIEKQAKALYAAQ